MDSKNQLADRIKQRFLAFRERHNEMHTRYINRMPMMQVNEQRETQEILQQFRSLPPKTNESKQYDNIHKQLKSGKEQPAKLEANVKPPLRPPAMSNQMQYSPSIQHQQPYNTPQRSLIIQQPFPTNNMQLVYQLPPSTLNTPTGPPQILVQTPTGQNINLQNSFTHYLVSTSHHNVSTSPMNKSPIYCEHNQQIHFPRLQNSYNRPAVQTADKNQQKQVYKTHHGKARVKYVMQDGNQMEGSSSVTMTYIPIQTQLHNYLSPQIMQTANRMVTTPRMEGESPYTTVRIQGGGQNLPPQTRIVHLPHTPLNMQQKSFKYQFGGNMLPPSSHPAEKEIGEEIIGMKRKHTDSSSTVDEVSPSKKDENSKNKTPPHKIKKRRGRPPSASKLAICNDGVRSKLSMINNNPLPASMSGNPITLANRVLTETFYKKKQDSKSIVNCSYWSRN